MNNNQQNEAPQSGIFDNIITALKKNKNTAMVVLALIIIAMLSYGLYENVQNKRYQRYWGDLFLAELAFISNANRPLDGIEDFVAKNPHTDAGAYAEFALGNAYFQLKDYANAQKYFKQLMSAPNKDMAALGEVSLIATLVAANSYEAAITQADNFAAKHPAHYALGQVKHHKALAQELSGKKAQALESYNQLVADYPNTYYAAFAKMRLEALK